MVIWGIFLWFFFVESCNGVIYHLNDTEYKRMPPLFGLDPYESCLRQAGGVYCLVRLDLQGDPQNKIMNLTKEYSAHTVKHYDHTYIERGVCIQKSCQKFTKNRNLDDTEVLNTTLERCLKESIWREYDIDVKLTEVFYCDKSGEVLEHDTMDWVVIGIVVAIFMINVIGSSCDVFFYKVKKEKDNWRGYQYLLSFSILQNWKFLISTESTDPRIEKLKGLHCLKTVTTFFMVIAHVMWVNSMGFTENPHEFEKAYEYFHYQVIFNGMMIIQIFIVLAAFLMTYNLLLRSEKEKITWMMFPKLMFLRWWRLSPANAVMLAFTATWLRHLGSGPLWRKWVTDSVSADCRRYWWLHLLYINNYVTDDKFCAIQTWYLGADMQVFAVGLAVFLATRFRKRKLMLSLMLAAGLVIPALHVWLQDLDGVVIMTPEFYRAKESEAFEIHVMGHNYLTCCAVGISTGCLVYYLQKKQVDLKNHKILRVLNWFLIPAIPCLFLAGCGFYADAPRASLLARAAWASVHRLLLSGIVSCIILSLTMRWSKSFCAAAEWPCWVVPGRLSYAVYLLHLNFVHILLGIRSHLEYVSFFKMIITHLGVVFLSFLVAIPFYLMVEAPMNRLMKNITSRHDQPHEKKMEEFERRIVNQS